MDNLIHSGVKEIVLDSDIILDKNEIREYLDGIRLDVDDLVIDGNGHTINAKGVRIFYCTGKNFTIENIILKNGYAEKTGGGAIYNMAELTITDSTLKGNTAQDGFGGAISDYEDELKIFESTLQENTAKYGGAIKNSEGELTVTGSTLIGNRAKERGGAICLSWQRKYESQNCTFRDNEPDDVYEKKD